MNKGTSETLTIRFISTSFVLLALAIFKPFGLKAWQWMAYLHLLAVWAMGLVICMLTDAIVKYVVRMPRSYTNGVEYISRRNLWFQLINTPLVALGICLYRHYVLVDKVGDNLLSWSNYFETLAIVAFCSFGMGLYWRSKFRNRYLALELRETRQLNEQLKNMTSKIPATQPSTANSQPSTLTLTGTTNDTVTLSVADLLYIETIGNYVKVYQLHDGQVCTDMLRATSKQMEEELQSYPMIVRCHRAFLVNLQQVEQIASQSGTMQLLIKHSHDTVPVSRSNMAGVKAAIRESVL